jgi:hypothetical protein
MLPEPSEHNLRSTPVRSCRSLKLAWTDPGSGDNLTISIRGGEQLLAGLEREGFTRLGDEARSTRPGLTSTSHNAGGSTGGAAPRGPLEFPPTGR